MSSISRVRHSRGSELPIASMRFIVFDSDERGVQKIFKFADSIREDRLRPRDHKRSNNWRKSIKNNSEAQFNVFA
jgi:hypothetical protein